MRITRYAANSRAMSATLSKPLPARHIGAHCTSSSHHCSCCKPQSEEVGLPLTALPLVTTKLPSNKAPGSGNAPFRFLDVPAELRCSVYAELLVGKVYFSHTDHEHERSARYMGKAYFQKPNLALPRVFNQIHQEAEPIYLSKNLFVLPLGWQHCQPFESMSQVKWEGSDQSDFIRKGSENSFYKGAMVHLRNVSFGHEGASQHGSKIFFTGTSWCWNIT